MGRVAELIKKSFGVLFEEGPISLAIKVKSYISAKIATRVDMRKEVFRDVLFIVGCGPDVPHPTRYRVTHQREQLLACHISSSEVYFEQLELDWVRRFRLFIFFRCPHTERVEEFIRLAKSLNKKVLFDIDDLVIDTKYTDQIDYLNTLRRNQREWYDEGVRRMGKTLMLCDGAITTTKGLARELENYVSEVFINRNTASEQMYSLSLSALEKKKSIKSQGEKSVAIGYFSGSITHNADFMLILPTLVEVLKRYPYVKLHVVGELDVPEELQEFKSQIVAHSFVKWKRLPELIAQVDINIAPLEVNVFNEAKSENKWVEAALVKVPTIASNVGAFAEMIKDGETGLLCNSNEEWENALCQLVENKEKRETIAEKAYEYCIEHCITTYAAFPLAKYVKSAMVPNVAFAVPMLDIRGGIKIVLKHAVILREAGFDVMLLNDSAKVKWHEFEGQLIPVMGQNVKSLAGRFDMVVATLFTTTRFLEKYANINKRLYLVQGYETDFSPPMSVARLDANSSYVPIVDMEFLTISKWCQEWLWDKFEQRATYAPNGISKKDFPHVERDFSGKIRVLIEGDHTSANKNIDEAFEVVSHLDRSRFEIWYMSYSTKPKSSYRVDKFLQQVPYEEVAKVYQQCHILLKTSVLESFSLPPLEMMATGGYSVVVPNGGNREYLVDEVNCLFYPRGDIEKGVAAIHRICEDEQLRETLYENGLQTAISRDWVNIKEDIIKLYCEL